MERFPRKFGESEMRRKEVTTKTSDALDAGHGIFSEKS
jgi:hypothetical protein